MVFHMPRPAPIRVRLATVAQVDRLARTVERLLGLAEQNAQEVAALRDRVAQLQVELESIKRPKRLVRLNRGCVLDRYATGAHAYNVAHTIYFCRPCRVTIEYPERTRD
jgi:hypothetical protein